MGECVSFTDNEHPDEKETGTSGRNADAEENPAAVGAKASAPESWAPRSTPVGAYTDEKNEESSSRPSRV